MKKTILIMFLFLAVVVNALPIPTSIYGTLENTNEIEEVIIIAYRAGSDEIIDTVTIKSSDGRFVGVLSSDISDNIDIVVGLVKEGIITQLSVTNNIVAGSTTSISIDTTENKKKGTGKMTKDLLSIASGAGSSGKSSSKTQTIPPISNDKDLTIDKITIEESYYEKEEDVLVKSTTHIEMPSPKVPVANIVFEFVLYLVAITLIVVIVKVVRKKRTI